MEAAGCFVDRAFPDPAKGRSRGIRFTRLRLTEQKKPPEEEKKEDIA